MRIDNGVFFTVWQHYIAPQGILTESTYDNGGGAGTDGLELAVGSGEAAGFRFAFVYLLLNCLPSMGTVSLAAAVSGGDYIAKPFEAMCRAVLLWFATRVFGIPGPAATFIENNGSGDTTLNYVQVFCWLVFRSSSPRCGPRWIAAARITPCSTTGSI
jgi:hypothetical protein